MIIWRSERGGKAEGGGTKEEWGRVYLCSIYRMEGSGDWATREQTEKSRQRREIGKENHQF